MRRTSFSPIKFLRHVVNALVVSQQNLDSVPKFRRSNIPHFHFKKIRLLVLIDIDVDGKMCVDVSHFVLVTLGDANDHVVDDGADGSEAGNGFSGTMVHFNADGVTFCVLEGYGKVLEVVDEFACAV